MSATVTVCVQVAVLPDPSVTVQVTVVLPSGKVAGASLVTEATLQLSFVVGDPRATPLAVQRPLSALTLTVAGQEIVGSSSSSYKSVTSVSKSFTFGVVPFIVAVPV